MLHFAGSVCRCLSADPYRVTWLEKAEKEILYRGKVIKVLTTLEYAAS